MGSGVSNLFHKPAPIKEKEEEKPYYVRIPLEKAVPAAIVIQTYVRMFLAKRVLENLIDEKEHQELAAAQYVHALVMNDVHSLHYGASSQNFSLSSKVNSSHNLHSISHAMSRSRKHSSHITESPLRLHALDHGVTSPGSFNEDKEFLFDDFMQHFQPPGNKDR